MKKLGILFVILTLSLVSFPVIASETLGSDAIISKLSYRGGYLIFQAKTLNGNSCSPCPADPGLMSSEGYCWVPETNATLVSMILTAHAQGKSFYARVNSWQQCSVYQFTINDN